MRITSTRFERAATGPADEPRAPGPDVVFVGRSNVGKSSLINRLLGVKDLARTSSRPGRTQSINFYRVNDSCYFVDLPGYGYAKVPESVRRAWKPMVEGFLSRRRRRIALVLLVVDARHEATELDLTMSGWLGAEEIPFVVAATKSDKLSGNQKARAERAMRTGFAGSNGCLNAILVSVETGLGIREVWRYLDSSLEEYRRREGSWTFES